MNNKVNSIMFHHFHDDKIFLKSQGSLNKDQFYKLLKRKIGLKNIINPEEYIHKLKNNKLKKNDFCLTFDDGIKSQFKIIWPVMEELKVGGFFFIFSSILEKKFNYLEIFRYFRENFFKNINIYYENFYYIYNSFNKNKNLNYIFKTNKKEIFKIKNNYKFYSLMDCQFRYIRDNLISNKEFIKIHKIMMKEKKFNYFKVYNNFYVNKNDIKKISNSYSQIGCHTHNHPTNINNLNFYSQKKEVMDNLKVLKNLTNTDVSSIAYPCGKYNENLLKFLEKKKFKIGFKSNFSNTPKKFEKFRNLLINRIDHTLI